MARKPDLIAMKRVFQNQRGFLCHFFAHYYFLWRIVSMRTKGIVLLCSLALLLGACQAGNNKTTTESSSAKTETTDKDKAKTLDKTSFMPVWLSSSRKMGTPALAMIKIKNLMPSLTGTIRPSLTTLAKQPLPIKLKIWPLR